MSAFVHWDAIALSPPPPLPLLASMPIPPSRTSPRNKDPDHIPRPRNAFMLYRSAFAAAQKITTNIEHDNRHITRIIAHCWNRLSDAEKQVWRDKATAEKAQHAQRYPNYRFSPVGRASRPVKRKVRRNGAEDVRRCEKLAELVMAGKFGEELESAINEVDKERLAAAHVAHDASTSAPTDPPSEDVPPFRSPLLPPAEIPCQPVQTPDRNRNEPLFVRTAPVHPVELPIYCSPTLSDGALDPLFYQPSPLDQFPSIHSFPHADPEQDFSVFSWNQPDSFTYYT